MQFWFYSNCLLKICFRKILLFLLFNGFRIVICFEICVVCWCLFCFYFLSHLLLCVANLPLRRRIQLGLWIKDCFKLSILIVKTVCENNWILMHWINLANWFDDFSLIAWMTKLVFKLKNNYFTWILILNDQTKFDSRSK